MTDEEKAKGARQRAHELLARIQVPWRQFPTCQYGGGIADYPLCDLLTAYILETAAALGVAQGERDEARAERDACNLEAERDALSVENARLKEQVEQARFDGFHDARHLRREEVPTFDGRDSRSWPTSRASGTGDGDAKTYAAHENAGPPLHDAESCNQRGCPWHGDRVPPATPQPETRQCWDCRHGVCQWHAFVDSLPAPPQPETVACDSRYNYKRPDPGEWTPLARICMLPRGHEGPHGPKVREEDKP